MQRLLHRSLLAAALLAPWPARAAERAWTLTIGEGISWDSSNILPGSRLDTRIGRSWRSAALFASLDFFHFAARDARRRVTLSLTTFGVGGRWTLPERSDMTPYLVGEAFTVFPVLSNVEGDSPGEADEGGEAQVRSGGFLGAFGAEFRPAQPLSIAAELGFSLWSGHYQQDHGAATRGLAAGAHGGVLLTLYFFDPERVTATSQSPEPQRTARRSRSPAGRSRTTGK